MINLIVENVYTRYAARELIKKHFWKLLGFMVTTVGIPIILSIVVMTLLGLTNNLTVLTVGGLVMLLVNILVRSGLSLGFCSAMIDLCRGDDTVTVGRVFSRMGECLKAFGLNLWVNLKVMLWSLPAFAMIVVLFFVNKAAENPALMTAESNQVLMSWLTILPFVVMVLIYALAIPAALRYMLSVYVLADKPETGVFDCVNQSKAMMKGHKWQAFKLTIPIALIIYAILMVIAAAMSALIAALGQYVNFLVLSTIMMIVMFAVMLYFMISVYLCYALFYIKRTKDQEPAQAE